MLFPDPATMIQIISVFEGMKEQKGAHFPWTHNKDVVVLYLHSMKIFAWKNQVAVPEC